MSNEALEAGKEFGTLIVESLCRTGVPEEGRVIFYATEIGVQLGNIAAHIGKDATLVILDVIRREISALPARASQ